MTQHESTAESKADGVKTSSVARPRRRRRQSNARQELHERLQKMEAALKTLVATPANRAFWTTRWAYYVDFAFMREESNRKQFYWARTIAIVAAVIVPSLVGLNYAGGASGVVQFLTFTLSLVAAVAGAVLAVFRFDERWFLYRTLQAELMASAWDLIANSDPEVEDAWQTFVKATEAAIAKYNGSYAAEVIQGSVQVKDPELHEH